MTPENEDFEEVRRLLALKRHEQPPPGYFTNFSSKVIARIEAEQETARLPWWRRLVASFDARPALVCAYALAVGGLFVVGLSLATKDDRATALVLPAAPHHSMVAAQPSTSAPVASAESVGQVTMQLRPMPSAEPQSSVNAVMDAPSSAPSDLFSPNGQTKFFGNPNRVSFSPESR
ncbi:MAG TPA: hypothetical protein VI454_06640 [Verrucomicrobiae bacterium]|jgi:hypothetical protein